MPHYLLFLPNKRGPSRQNLSDVGLGDLLLTGDDPHAWSDLDGHGPGETPGGQIVTWNDPPVYQPTQQTWRQSKSGQYWFGTWNGKPTKPQDIQRRHPIKGLMQTLLDGQDWQLPNVTQLPSVFDLDAKGEPVRVATAPYSAFADECLWVCDAVITAIETGIEPDDWKRIFKFAVWCLTVNYRVNAQIAVWLGLLDDTLIHTIAAKATDAARIRDVIEELKKKDVASTAAG